MKKHKNIFIFFPQLPAVILLILISISTTLISNTWRGTAPFCAGECLSGETQIETSSTGDGGYCWTGEKVLCSNPELSCTATQTNTSCLGFVTICDNGSYNNTHNNEYPVWESFSKYVCGACLGFDF